MTTTDSTPGSRSCWFGRRMTVAVCLMLAAGSTGHADDAWVFIASPNAGAFSNQLFDVDASSPQDTWAVGVSTSSLLDKPDTLAMRWDGEAWTIVPTPNPNPSLQSNRLYDVTVIGPGDAWAVGSATFGSTTSPLLLHWDGAEWTVDSAGGLPPSSAHAVHALAADDVWALGLVTQGGTGFTTLAAHYDGSNWTPMNVPNAAFGGLQFQAVDGLASDDVWAAGFENPGSGIFAPLVAHWDGSEWTSTNPEPVGGCTLHDIAMIASDDVWAVGRCPVAEIGDQPYAVHWDGSSWTQAPMPLFEDGHARLEGVVARASDDVWAAGTNGDANGIPRPLIMHYDGVGWQEVTTPPSGGSHEWFLGMGAAPNGEIWAVGQYFTGSETSTLTARRAPTLPADLNMDGAVDIQDFLMLLAEWGPCDGCGDCPADLDGDCEVGILDFLMMLANWG